MGHSYFASKQERLSYERQAQERRDQETARIEDERRKLAAKIVMSVVDKIVNEIVRPGPKPEERECYEMAGELRASIPDLEALAKQIIDVNDGVE